jgi:hypothetical protein
VGISTNADRIAKAWMRRATALEPYMRKATTEATRAFYAEAKAAMKRGIYDKPIPTKAEMQAERRSRSEAKGKTFSARKKFTTAKGTANVEGRKPAWRRTGNLRRSEKYRVASAYLGLVINDASAKGKGYAKPRHEMGKPGHRGTRFPAHWRDDAARITRRARLLIYRKALRQAWQDGIIHL